MLHSRHREGGFSDVAALERWATGKPGRGPRDFALARGNIIADVAQLVEHWLAKSDVASSNLVIRSVFVDKAETCPLRSYVFNGSTPGFHPGSTGSNPVDRSTYLRLHLPRCNLKWRIANIAQLAEHPVGIRKVESSNLSVGSL